VRARTKDLVCHKDGKNFGSPELLPWPKAADLASEGNSWLAAVGSSWGTKRGKEGGGTPFIPRERGVAGFRV
jgi:hypothetical protein